MPVLGVEDGGKKVRKERQSGFVKLAPLISYYYPD